jgi:hypothetical protein
MKPKGALAASLQGQPEEFSPATPVDCYRLAGYIYNRLADMYPEAGWELFNRDDFPGQGDNFIGVRNAIVAYGADFAVHVHQDAGGEPGARGWHIIYYHGEALSLANELVYAMRALPSPMRYGGIVCRSNVAVLKAPKVSVLVEAGFYTSIDGDEAIGIEGWGNAIIHGISNYLQHHWGLSPVGEEEEEMVEFTRMADEEGQGIFKGQTVASFKAYGKGTDWIHASINSPGQEKFLLLFNVQYPAKRDVQCKEVSDGYYGRVQQMTGYIGADEYAWVGVHVPVDLAGSFRGFIRK